VRTFVRMFCCALALALSACNGSSSSSPTTPVVGPTPSSTYPTFAVINIPGVPPATGTWSFDISFVDGTAGQYYLADRTNKAVDVINLSTKALSFAGQGSFVGAAAAGSNFSGPNGVVSIGGGLVMAGDGNSTLKIVNVTTGAFVSSVNAVNPVTAPVPAIANDGLCNATGTATAGAANGRTDEMAFDPRDGLVLAINDVACPPFGTFFSTTSPFSAIASISFPTATAGVEQPVWDPSQGKFLVAIPATIANPGGEVDVIDIHGFQVTAVFPEPNNCQGNGLALGPNEHLFIGCSNVTGPLVVMNATNGATIATVTGAGGGDEVWYNPTANRFYCACSNNTAGPVVPVIDASTNALITTLTTSTGAHSIAVDPSKDVIYVPQRAGGNNGVTTFGH
jgi:hypothetical protein